MTELLASVDDINTWLVDDKLEANEVNSASQQIDAWRLIRGQLVGTFDPTTVAAWTDPLSTPDQIRAIAGRLIAAYMYRSVYAEDLGDIPPYAQTLYNEAIQMLSDIRNGTTTVVDENGNPISDNQLDMSSDDIFPNNNTTDGPYFLMGQVFG